MADDLIKRVMAELAKDGKPVGMMECNKCGFMAAYHPTDVTVEQVEQAGKETIMRMKEHFAENGWQTSWGYDLCPACARA